MGNLAVCDTPPFLETNCLEGVIVALPLSSFSGSPLCHLWPWAGGPACLPGRPPGSTGH
jgi:hypothetical protein